MGSIDWSFRMDLWAASAAMAVFAAYVALDLARGASSRHRFTVIRSVLSSTLALSAGTWAAFFIAMAHEPLPFPVGYDPLLTISSLALAFITSLSGVYLSALPSLDAKRVTMAALVLGTGACLVPGFNFLGLRLTPLPQWNLLLLAAGWLGACLCAGLALAVVAAQRKRGEGNLRVVWQGVVSIGLGASIVVGGGAVLSAASIPELAMSEANAQTQPGTVSALSALGVPALLGLLLMMSILEDRLRKLLKRTRDEMKRAAQTDPLTGLPNRSMFEEGLHLSAIQADRQKHSMALLYMNLDGLKSVNESFGQGTGDAVLRAVGKRLREIAGPDNMAARAGGDEFLLLLQNNPVTQDAAQMAQRILNSMHELCRVEDHDITMSCTVGIAMYPKDGVESKLIAHASAAMRAAKHDGGATSCFFEPSMVAGAREQVELLHDLRRALRNKELELYYQPKIHALSGQVTGCEALMRWNHPQRGLVGPVVFIPLAERFGLIKPLGNWLIEEACRQIRVWRDGGLRMRVSVNLSVHQLRQGDLVEHIVRSLKTHRIDPSLLTCEITESSAMDDTRVTLQKIEQLSAAGIHLSIDDFGTGYSSLSYLRQLDAEELKIDRSFVMDLETSADARAIVDAIVKLAQALGLKVVAEGVETEQQQDILRRLGCNELQGYLFAKPMPAAALALWAMTEEGPRALAFRPSLFGETLPQELDPKAVRA